MLDIRKNITDIKDVYDNKLNLLKKYKDLHNNLT